MTDKDEAPKIRSICGDPRCHITYIPHEATPTHIEILNLVEQHRGVTKSWLTAEARVVYGNMEFGHRQRGRGFGERKRPAWFTPETWGMYVDAEQRAIYKRRQRMLAYVGGVGVLLVVCSFLPGSYLVQATMGGLGAIMFGTGVAWMCVRASVEAERMTQVMNRKRLADNMAALEKQRRQHWSEDD